MHTKRIGQEKVAHKIFLLFPGCIQAYLFYLNVLGEAGRLKMKNGEVGVGHRLNI